MAFRVTTTPSVAQTYFGSWSSGDHRMTRSVLSLIIRHVGPVGKYLLFVMWKRVPRCFHALARAGAVKFEFIVKESCEALLSPAISQAVPKNKKLVQRLADRSLVWFSPRTDILEIFGVARIETSWWHSGLSDFLDDGIDRLISTLHQITVLLNLVVTLSNSILVLCWSQDSIHRTKTSSWAHSISQCVYLAVLNRLKQRCLLFPTKNFLSLPEETSVANLG